MTDYRDHHATVFVAPEVARRIESLRREYDPVMAAQIAAHVTLVYPQEVPSAEILVERLRGACAETSPFRLRLGKVAYFGRPEEGVYVEVEDVDGGLRAPRDVMLEGWPSPPHEYLPHVTLVHPRTSRRGRDLWNRVRGRRYGNEFRVDTVAITAFDGARWITLETFALTG